MMQSLARNSLPLRNWLALMAGTVLLSVASAGAQVTALPPQSAPLDELPVQRVLALCVGVNDYDDVIYDDLKFAVNDAEKVAELFATHYGFETTVLSDGKATRADVLRELDVIINEAGEEDAIIFYFGGHGEAIEVRDGEAAPFKRGYLVLAGADLRQALEAEMLKSGSLAPVGEEEPETRSSVLRTLKTPDTFDKFCLSSIELRDQLARSRAKHVLIILDCCFSGLATSITRGGAEMGPEEKSKAYLDYLRLSGRSRMVLTAGTAEQKSMEHQRGTCTSTMFNNKDCSQNAEVAHGVFTAELIDALSSPKATSVWNLFDSLNPNVFRTAQRYFERSLTPVIFPSEETSHAGVPGQFVFVPVDARKKWLKAVEGEAAADADVRRKNPKRGVVFRAQKAEEEAELDSKVDLLFFSREVAKIKQKQAKNPTFRPEANLAAEWVDRYNECDKRARMGDADAKASLYYAKAYGLGVQPDEAAAYHWASDARAAGSPEGKLAVVDALQAGIGVERSASLAERLKPRSAEANLAAGSMVLAAGAAKGDVAEMLIGGIVAGFAAVNLLSDTPDKSLHAMLKAQERTEQAFTNLKKTHDSKKASEAVGKWREAAKRFKAHVEGMGEGTLFAQAPRLCDSLIVQLDALGKDTDKIRDDLPKAFRTAKEINAKLEALWLWRKVTEESAEK